jgi:hypothetical protein
MQNVQQFQPGEVVDVAIKNVRYVSTNEWFHTVEGTEGLSFQVPEGPSVLTRVAPKEWPPQPGDVWEDRNGHEWMATAHGANYVQMISQDGDPWSFEHEVLGSFGPLRLVRRRGWTPDAEPPAADPSTVDKRAEMVAGLRALADLVEANPTLPFPLNDVLWNAENMDSLRAWARELGTEIKPAAHRGDIHHTAEALVRGLEVRAYVIEHGAAPKVSDEPAETPEQAAAIADANLIRMGVTLGGTP